MPAKTADSRVVLITGVSRYLGGKLAALLAADSSIERIIGVDVVPPRQDVGRTEFVRADIRNPIIAKVIASAHVDTVVHMSVIATPFGAGGRTAMKEINVIGTMQLLAACQKAPSLRKLVVKSTTAVYGSSSRDPALFVEGMEPKAQFRSGYGKDSIEVEGYVRGLGRRRPDVDVTLLRFANFIGPRIDTPLTRYFALPVVPAVFGFDPRVQFIHEDDGIEVLRRAVVENHRGTFNVAGDGVLLLSQAIRRAGRVSVPVPSPAVSLVGSVFRRAGLVDFSPEQVQFLEFGRGVDTTRLREDFGYDPRFRTIEAFDDFVTGRGLTRYVDPERLASVEQLVLSGVERRRVHA
ncbi:MAG TPA: NAD-dependent epimerase/dehydratase family protein [Mycobacteriales bacterium]|nr:NAD-dependent epimerase/dehydratase family protein [Mycobacteriales bacterium]